MANFVKHMACPSCGSRNNLAVYDDGSEYCFGCGKTKTGHSTLTSLVKPMNDKGTVSLPNDFVSYLPQKARDYLSKYGITGDKNLGWLEEKEALCIKIYGYPDNQLLGYQYRVLKTDYKGPKWVKNGNIHAYPSIILNNASNELVAVEDYLSALKVSAQYNAWCLFGSNINKDQALFLSKDFDKLHVWLDFDKASTSIGYANQYNWMYKEGAKSIITDKDPKEEL